MCLNSDLHTYLWGSYSPINGGSFVWEINGVDANNDNLDKIVL